jgi:hypothetical protein
MTNRVDLYKAGNAPYKHMDALQITVCSIIAFLSVSTLDGQLDTPPIKECIRHRKLLLITHLRV